MNPETGRWLDKARRGLTVARRDLDAGDSDHAVARAYYAAFHTATVALYESGHVAQIHTGVQALFYQTFVQGGALDVSLAQTLARLQQRREAADYGVRELDVETARESIEQAEAFVDAVEAWLTVGPG